MPDWTPRPGKLGNRVWVAGLEGSDVGANLGVRDGDAGGPDDRRQRRRRDPSVDVVVGVVLPGLVGDHAAGITIGSEPEDGFSAMVGGPYPPRPPEPRSRVGPEPLVRGLDSPPGWGGGPTPSGDRELGGPPPGGRPRIQAGVRGGQRRASHRPRTVQPQTYEVQRVAGPQQLDRAPRRRPSLPGLPTTWPEPPGPWWRWNRGHGGAWLADAASSGIWYCPAGRVLADQNDEALAVR